MEHVGDLVEDICLYLLLGVGMIELDANGPVSEGEASNTAVGAGSAIKSDWWSSRETGRPQRAACSCLEGHTHMIFCSVMILTCLLTWGTVSI